ncbi:hypothetical protein [Arthrobacter sp. Leaf137]|uniref:hypothetical protein n=1 Tax=Arthrobacter sp. Leaf137 TaxID=1736271 RepID=UPI00070148C6|nr:hypothetical protein [Arthrobacter sp. Leaf137]KQQ85238.1 hypothetical protein ASF64_03680 [Arthrobacter sp. Leaf137]
MMMNNYNVRLARKVLEAIQNLENGTRTLAETQSVLESAAPLCENDGSGLEKAIRLAAADLESIQFTTMRDEQTPAAIFSLANLRAALQAADTESP